MKKLLNTLYVTSENSYLSLDGENVVVLDDKTEIGRLPLHNLEGIVSFGYRGTSPALMRACAEQGISLCYLTPQGKFLAKVCGETKGNVFLRVAQIDRFRENGLALTQNTMAAKFSNTRQLIRRTLHDNSDLREDGEIQKVLEVLSDGIDKVYRAESIEEVVGIEGYCAQSYFSVFHKLITNKKVPFTFELRTKRPPLDPINAVLSFVYTLATSEFAAALETVGLDSYIGFCHTLRSGRVSLACDMVEEARCIVERFVITLLNLQVIGEKDFEKQLSGAVWLNEDGRKKVLARWQEKKRSDLVHPYLKQKIPMGLLPYVQSNLLAKHIRGELDQYPPFLLK